MQVQRDAPRRCIRPCRIGDTREDAARVRWKRMGGGGPHYISAADSRCLPPRSSLAASKIPTEGIHDSTIAQANLHPWNPRLGNPSESRIVNLSLFVFLFLDSFIRCFCRRTQIPRDSPYSQYQNMLVEMYNNREGRENDTFTSLD